MFTRDIQAFVEFARRCPADFGPATARAAFLVAPDGFARADESASDNRYMHDSADFDASGALQQHHGLQRALASELPVLCFAGDAGAPDGVFPNNVFATAPGRLIVGRMRHAVRRTEAGRSDIRQFFSALLHYQVHDLSQQTHACELTGSLVIDRARGVGFCGLSERCDPAGAALMHQAFGLRATLLFDLAAGEYHANVVLAILAGRAALVCAAGFADPAVATAIIDLYAPHGIALGAGEQAAFAGNAISLHPESVWMSAGAEAALRPHTRRALATAGFGVRAVALQAVEAAGGSLRCCVAEIY